MIRNISASTQTFHDSHTGGGATVEPNGTAVVSVLCALELVTSWPQVWEMVVLEGAVNGK